jgi:hypothetical protein
MVTNSFKYNNKDIFKQYFFICNIYISMLMLPKNSIENDNTKDYELYLQERKNIARYLISRKDHIISIQSDFKSPEMFAAVPPLPPAAIDFN